MRIEHILQYHRTMKKAGIQPAYLMQSVFPAQYYYTPPPANNSR